MCENMDIAITFSQKEHMISFLTLNNDRILRFKQCWLYLSNYVVIQISFLFQFIEINIVLNGRYEDVTGYVFFETRI